MPKAWRWLAISLAAATPAAGAVVREHAMVLEVRPDGAVSEHVSLTVAIEKPADLERWSPYPIFLDTNRKLVRVEASATPPSGETRKVPRRSRDRAALAGDALHTSMEAELVEFPAMPVGSLLHVEYEVLERPYFPSGLLVLGRDDRIDSLRVEVRGAGPSFRYRLDGAPAGLAAQAVPGGVTIGGALPAYEELERAPEPRGPVLRYAWGPGGDWASVGRWYADLIAQLPRGSAEVRAAAGAGKSAERRQQTLERLTALARSQVRYVAVEVGVGGYRPSAPSEVLGRRWGDCKDKALLLVDLLAAAGIDARVALAWVGDGPGIQPTFAAPDGFDHAIVAVPATGWKLPAGAPVADGWLLLDATQDRGGLAWLHPGLRGRPVLVVEPGGGRLVEVPVEPAAESSTLTVEATIAGDGGVTGRAELTFAGATAEWLEDLAKRGPEGAAEARTLLADYLPGGSRLAAFRLQAPATADAPAAALSADVTLDGLVPPAAQASFVLAGRAATPEPALFDHRADPVEVWPRVASSTWRLELPTAGCAVEGADVDVDGKVGAFHQHAAVAGRTLTVSRRTELRRRLVAGEDSAELAALAVAEHRALKKRIRLRCAP